MAEVLLKENEKYVGKDVAEKAIEKLNNTEEGGNTNEQKQRELDEFQMQNSLRPEEPEYDILRKKTIKN